MKNYKWQTCGRILLTRSLYVAGALQSDTGQVKCPVFDGQFKPRDQIRE